MQADTPVPARLLEEDGLGCLMATPGVYSGRVPGSEAIESSIIDRQRSRKRLCHADSIGIESPDISPMFSGLPRGFSLESCAIETLHWI